MFFFPSFQLSSLFDAVLSPDGRFVAACGFTPDVLVYEVHSRFDFIFRVYSLFSITFQIVFNRDGIFQDAKKAFNLKVLLSVIDFLRSATLNMTETFLGAQFWCILRGLQF